MKRFGMVESESCEICGAIETVSHQLFECQNAKKQRDFALSISPTLLVPNFYSLLEISTNQKAELIKALIIRNLIQLDRSKDSNRDHFERQFNYYSNICNL